MSHRFLIRGLTIAVFITAANISTVEIARAQEKCAYELDVKSSGGATDAGKRAVTFDNQTQYTRQVFWLDYDGKRSKKYGGDIGAQRKLPIDTYVGHWFVVTNSVGACVGVYGIGSETEKLYIHR